MAYVDGYILPLPEKNIEAYREMAQLAGSVWMEHGALAYKECIGEDLESEWAEGSFLKVTNAKAGEKVIFAFIVFESREHRDEVNERVHDDPRIIALGEMEEASMPFDGNRMTYGGFETLVDL